MHRFVFWLIVEGVLLSGVLLLILFLIEADSFLASSRGREPDPAMMLAMFAIIMAFGERTRRLARRELRRRGW